MSTQRKRWIRNGLCVAMVLGTVGLIYLHHCYVYYSRLVDRTLEAGAFAHTIDIYASPTTLGTEQVPAEFVTNLSSENREKRHLVRFDEIPETLIHAVLSVEDKHFFDHRGLDFPRIAEAARINLTTGRKQQGASTISMQLARSLWLDRGKTWERKVVEAFMAIRLERKLSKTKIFELYANQIDLSQHGTFNVHGFGEAARVFFGKEISDLTLAESATLAGLIQRPSYYSPTRYPERARARRNLVLGLMHENGYASDADYAAAVASPLETVSHPETDSSEAPYFVDLLKQELESKLPQADSRNTKYRVNTTLDLALQQDAVEAVRLGMQEVERQLALRKQSFPTPQVALIALDPHTGEIKALVGGRSYNDSQLNRAMAERQPGSIFKPFVYAAALEATLRSPGTAVTPATILRDEPTTFSFDQQTYSPRNYGHEFYGDLTLRTALAKSVNVATVQLAEMVGYPAVVQVARAAGLAETQPTPAVALGAYDATPLEMAGAYTIFANSGTYVEPHFITTVQGEDGSTIYTSEPQRRRVLDPRVAYQMVSLLQEVLQTGTGAGVRTRGFVVPAAGKTGTSRDGWFAGFTSNLLTLVWVGFDDHRDLHLEGARSALPVWTEFMKRAMRHGASAQPFPAPPGIVGVAVDPKSGELAGPLCESSRLEFFVIGTEPQESCGLHKLDQATQLEQK